MASSLDMKFLLGTIRNDQNTSISLFFLSSNSFGDSSCDFHFQVRK